MSYRQKLETWRKTHFLSFGKRKAISQTVVLVAIGLILFATVGFVGLQLLATAGTTSFQPTVVIISITVVSIVAALAVALGFLKLAGIKI